MSLYSSYQKISVLFILRKRNETWGQTNPYCYNSSGLLNSANFVNIMLQQEGIKSHLVEVTDGNSIDREVTNFNPDIIILEAIWVTPAKIKELAKLHRHRNRKWIIRNHSELPFLALEGISLQWLLEYSSIKNVTVSCNSPVATKDISILTNLQYNTPIDKVLYLPNYYPIVSNFNKHLHNDILNVGCFGAIRPLKNHIIQAIAAISFAKKINKPLNFHVNISRIECKADPIVKSLRAVFGDLNDYKLIEHTWLERNEFLKLCNSMDIGLQVSFSETFNIVTADLVSEGVPCVTSSEVPWIPKQYHVNPTSSKNIVDKIELALYDGVSKQLKGLHEYVANSKWIWLKELLNLIDN